MSEQFLYNLFRLHRMPEMWTIAIDNRVARAFVGPSVTACALQKGQN